MSRSEEHCAYDLDEDEGEEKVEDAFSETESIMYGPYTKKDVTELLLQAIALPITHPPPPGLLDALGLPPEDFLMLRQGREGIGNVSVKILNELGLTESMFIRDYKQELTEFLLGKGISRKLTFMCLEHGLTQEMIRLLQALDFTDDDIATLVTKWNYSQRFSRRNSDSVVHCESDWSTRMSCDSIYLKNFVGKPLMMALREIVVKKPLDPIDYLGHWLLHHRVCEERSIKQKEFDLELLVKRERQKMMELREMKGTPRSIDRGETEEEDVPFLEYASEDVLM